MELQISQDKDKAYGIIKKAIEMDPINDFPYETLAKLESERSVTLFSLFNS